MSVCLLSVIWGRDCRSNTKMHCELWLRSSKRSCQSTAAGHVGQNSSARVACSVAAIWPPILLKWSQLMIISDRTQFCTPPYNLLTLEHSIRFSRFFVLKKVRLVQVGWRKKERTFLPERLHIRDSIVQHFLKQSKTFKCCWNNQKSTFLSLFICFKVT